MISRLALLLILCVLARPAVAAIHVTDPWPDQADVTGVRDITVGFRSSDPFSPAEIGHAAARNVTAELFLPPDAGPAHPAPAVILLHGSAGNTLERGERYGPALASMGIAVLVVNTYASRTDLGTNYIERVLHITETMFVADAYAGLRYLATRPDIDATHVALAGFSYGGMATTYAMYAQLADRLAPPGLRFVGHVAFYAPCIARFRDSRTTGAPLLMLYGERDQLIDPGRCAQIAQDLRSGGSDVTIVAYPGAAHQWDGEMALGTIGRQLADCSFMVNRDGSVDDQLTHMAMSSPFRRKLILGLCTSARPYPIGHDEATRMRSNHDFAAFLARVLAPQAATRR